LFKGTANSAGQRDCTRVRSLPKLSKALEGRWLAFREMLPASAKTICLDARRFNIVADKVDSHLREFGSSAFSGCRSLRSIAIPSSVSFLGWECFTFCKSHESVLFESHGRQRGARDKQKLAKRRPDENMNLFAMAPGLPSSIRSSRVLVGPDSPFLR
jgi:hypothetical protein